MPSLRQHDLARAVGNRAGEGGATNGRAACSASQAVEAAAAAVIERFSLNADQAAVVRSTIPWFAASAPTQVRLFGNWHCAACHAGQSFCLSFTLSIRVEHNAPC